MISRYGDAFPDVTSENEVLVTHWALVVQVMYIEAEFAFLFISGCL